MTSFDKLINEIDGINFGPKPKTARNVLMYSGYANHLDDPVPIARAYAAAALFEGHYKHVYRNDLVAGSLYGLFVRGPEADSFDAPANETAKNFGSNTFWTGVDHFAPDYEVPLADGVGGMLNKIINSREKFIVKNKNNEYDKNIVFLNSAGIAMKAYSNMIDGYGSAARELSEKTEDEVQIKNLRRIAEACDQIKTKPPRTFFEALQLVWLTHAAFLYEGRYAMALGRMDQFLYPFYRRDIDAGVLSRDEALDLLKRVFIKII